MTRKATYTVTLYPKNPDYAPVIRTNVTHYCTCYSSTGDAMYILKFEQGSDERYPMSAYSGLAQTR